MKTDVGGLLEPNIEWRNQPPEGSFYIRKKTCPKQPIKAVVASNTTEPPQLMDNGEPKKLLHGGCILMPMNPLITYRIVSVSKDPEQLGRWCSFEVEGKKGRIIRYVTGYITTAEYPVKYPFQPSKNSYLEELLHGNHIFRGRFRRRQSKLLKSERNRRY